MTRLLWLLLLIPLGVSGQTDSLMIQMSNGKIKSYSVNDIGAVNFEDVDKVGVSIRDIDIMNRVIKAFSLKQNYPNPFNPSTTISYSVPTNGTVKIRVFDIQGRLIKDLFQGEKVKGDHFITWDATTNQGNSVSSGSYLVQVIYNNSTLVKQMILIR